MQTIERCVRGDTDFSVETFPRYDESLGTADRCLQLRERHRKAARSIVYTFERIRPRIKSLEVSRRDFLNILNYSRHDGTGMIVGTVSNKIWML